MSTARDLGALLRASLGRSDVIWLRTDRDRATWFASVPDESPAGPPGSLLVVSGGPEPDVGDLAVPAGRLHLVLRAKGDGRRLLVLPASATELAAPSSSGEAGSGDGDRWTSATDLLRAQRLGGGQDIVRRWAAESCVWLVRPVGRPVESPDVPAPTDLVATTVRPLP